jgi:hypothetical protein
MYGPIISHLCAYNTVSMVLQEHKYVLLSKAWSYSLSESHLYVLKTSLQAKIHIFFKNFGPAIGTTQK